MRLATVVITDACRDLQCISSVAFKIESCYKKEAVVCLLWSKDVAILPTGFEENPIHQGYTTAKANVQMLKQIEEIKGLGFLPSVCQQ